jgi:BirA family biotin operon repressor/biotin-[acetyl-CoA-carboxylase] ligase
VADPIGEAAATNGAAWFDEARFARAREARGLTWGSPLSAPRETGSTNDLALEAERNGLPEGATFVAHRQTAGRGRRGSVWLASPGENLTFSVLTRPERELAQAAPLPLVVGLALRDVVSERIRAAAGWLREPVLVKWPNDVLVGSRKIAGVLVESRLRGSVVGAAVIGIGLNVLTETFPEAIAGRATSLARAVRAASPGAGRDALASTLAHEELLTDVLAALEQRYRRFSEEGLAAFTLELASADALRDQRVRVEGVEGVGAGITETGSLRLRDDAGREHIVSAGHVELLGARA